MAEQFPELINMRQVRISIDESFNWIVEHWGETLEQIFLPVVHLLTAIENFLLWLPWYVVLAIIAGRGLCSHAKLEDRCRSRGHDLSARLFRPVGAGPCGRSR